MPQYQELTTVKYWHAKVEEEAKELHLQKNRDAIRSFSHFVLAITVFLITIFVVQQSPIWLPQVSTFIEQTGIF